MIHLEDVLKTSCKCLEDVLRTSKRCNVIDITFQRGCSSINLLHIFRTPFSKNTSIWLLLQNVSLGLVIISLPSWKHWNNNHLDKTFGQLFLPKQKDTFSIKTLDILLIHCKNCAKIPSELFDSASEGCIKIICLSRL